MMKKVVVAAVVVMFANLCQGYGAEVWNQTKYPLRVWVNYVGLKSGTEAAYIPPNGKYADGGALLDASNMTMVQYMPDPTKPNEWLGMQGSPDHTWTANFDQNWTVNYSLGDDGELGVRLNRGKPS